MAQMSCKILWQDSMQDVNYFSKQANLSMADFQVYSLPTSHMVDRGLLIQFHIPWDLDSKIRIMILWII